MEKKNSNGQTTGVATSAIFKMTSAKELESHSTVNVKFTFPDGSVEKTTFVSYKPKNAAMDEVEFYLIKYPVSKDTYTDYIKFIQGWLDYYDASRKHWDEPIMEIR